MHHLPQNLRIALDDRHDLLVDAFLAGPPTHLFNTPEFFRLHAAAGGAGAGSHYFQLAEHAGEHALACLHFTEVSPGHWRSPARGTFGSFGYVDGIATGELELLLQGAERCLATLGARELVVVQPPGGHDAARVGETTAMLTRNGYTMLHADINQDLQVDERLLPERMSRGNLKRFRKCMREGWQFVELPQARHAEAYQLIADNRRRRGHPITMSHEGLVTMDRLFPGRVHYFALVHEGRPEDMAASAICMRITTDILYVFYWGDAADMQTLSPVVGLAAGIYEYCRHEGIHILDAGISTAQGIPNPGLLHFKQGLGFSESPRATLMKRMTAHA